MKDSEREGLKKETHEQEKDDDDDDELDEQPWHFEGSDSTGTIGLGRGRVLSNSIEKRNASLGGSSGDLAS